MAAPIAKTSSSPASSSATPTPAPPTSTTVSTTGSTPPSATSASTSRSTENATSRPRGTFRFLPDGSRLEVLQNTTNNTWGLAFTDHGELVGSTANGNSSWYLSVPNRYFQTVGLNPEKTPRAFPITTDYFQNWPKEKFSSASGHDLVTGERFPEPWTNRRALICEPPPNLVSAPVLENRGTTFRTTNFEQNLYASADAWSAPAAAATGPDGAAWIAD